MPPPPLLDVTKLDMNRVAFDREALRQTNPQRHEFEQLDGVLVFDAENLLAVAYRDIRDDEWWCKGHIPGRPLFPGVLMLEAAAQMASFMIRRLLDDKRFIGFGGVDEARFRGTVTPPARLLIVGKGIKLDRRQSTVAAQGFVDGKIVFEAKILGVFL